MKIEYGYTHPCAYQDTISDLTIVAQLEAEQSALAGVSNCSIQHQTYSWRHLKTDQKECQVQRLAKPGHKENIDQFDLWQRDD